ncbi:MAG: M56 family metallopeptidase [Saprospiraceae bacterium]
MFLHTNVSELMAWTIVHSLWIGLFFGGLLYGLLQWGEKKSAQWRYSLSVGIFFSFFLATVAVFFYLNHEVAMADFELIANTTPPQISSNVKPYTAPLTLEEVYNMPIEEEDTNNVFQLSFLSYLWLLGFVIALLRMFAGQYFLRKIRNSSIALPESINNTVQSIASAFQYNKSIKLLQSEKVESPFTIGWWKPVIYLPLAIHTQLSPKELEAILAHEISHIVRQDYLVKFLQSLVQTLLYYHPVMWWISNRIDEEREHCCDDQAVSYTTDPLSYAQALVQVATFGNTELPQLGLSFSNPKHKTMNRIKRLFGQTSDVKQSTSPRLFIALGLSLVLAFSVMSPLKKIFGTDDESNYITYDIENFWNAYDKILTTSDSIQQYTYIKELYLDKASPGLKAFRKRKGYTADDYIHAINTYPKFWASIRSNTLQAERYAKEIEVGVNKLKKLYPDLKPSNIYFTIGALRSGGTTLDGMVLIGAEIAMADERAVTEELPDWLRKNLRTYFDSNPIKDITFLNVHEYVHTQQKTQGGHELLSQCVYEGIAEFVTVIATGEESPVPAIHYGKANDEKVQARFVKELLSPYYMNWLYNNFNNEFNTRDLGYYIGYAISEKYYEKAEDKGKAIKELMKLSFYDPKDMQDFVDQTGYFSKPMSELIKIYEANQPQVMGISPFDNGEKKVDPNTKEITIHFNMPMDKFTNFEFGPEGEKCRLPIEKVIGFSEDKKSVTIAVDLVGGKRYQVYVNFGFRNLDGIRLEPYLIDFKTSN